MKRAKSRIGGKPSAFRLLWSQLPVLTQEKDTFSTSFLETWNVKVSFSKALWVNVCNLNMLFTINKIDRTVNTKSACSRYIFFHLQKFHRSAHLYSPLPMCLYTIITLVCASSCLLMPTPIGGVSPKVHLRVVTVQTAGQSLLKSPTLF